MFPFTLADGEVPKNDTNAALNKTIENFNNGKIDVNPSDLAVNAIWMSLVGYGIYKLVTKKKGGK